MRLFAGYVHDVEGDSGGIRDHDGPIGGFPFDLGGPRVGMALRSGYAVGEEFLLELRHDVAVLRVHHREGAEFLASAERREKLVVLDHERSLVGHEVLERVDAHVDGVLHFIENGLVPARDRHVVSHIRANLRLGLAVPFVDGVLQRTVGSRQTEVDEHGGAPGGGGPCARFEGFRRRRSHEGHLEMSVRINAARHHVSSLGVDIFVAGEVRSDLLDRFVLDQNVRLERAVGRNHRSALDYATHRFSLLGTKRRKRRITLRFARFPRPRATKRPCPPPPSPC